MKHTILNRICILLIVLLNIGCDQVSKEIVREKVSPMDYIQVVGDHFIVTHVENSGAMLGFGQNLSPLLKIIFLQILPIVVLVILLLKILTKKHMDKWLLIAFAFVIGGGIGNLMDRILYGSVTDFFQIKLGILKTGIFNMADVSVSMGVLMILYLSMRRQKL